MAKELVLVQQNDTHGSIELHHEFFWNNNHPETHEVGGFSRISKYVKNLKSKKRNVLFLDGGDLFHGTAPLVFSKGQSLLPALKAMPLDGFVPGNWDFAYGKDHLIKLTEDLPFEAVACNVTEGSQSFLTPYFIKELDEMTVGVIGITYPFVDKTMPDKFSAGLKFSLGVSEVENIVEQLKGNVDVIILISHMGLPLDVKLANIVNGIDVILSGHTHDRINEPILQNNTIIVQSGASSSFLGKLELIIEGKKVISFNHELITVSDAFEEDEEMQEMVSAILAPYQQQKEEIVGYTDSILHRMTLNEAPMDRLITDAYLQTFGCDVAFSHGWRYGTPIPTGPVSMYDLYSIIPTNPEIFTTELEGRELIKALEKNLEQVFSADPFGQKGGYILRSSGLMMTFKPYNPEGYRIQEMYIGGDRINPSKTYKVAGAGEQLFKGMETDKHFRNTNAVDVLKDFFKQKQKISFTHEPKIICV